LQPPKRYPKSSINKQGGFINCIDGHVNITNADGKFDIKLVHSNDFCPSFSSLIPAFDAYLCKQRNIDYMLITDTSTYSLLRGIKADGRSWEETERIPSVLWNAMFMGRTRSRLSSFDFHVAPESRIRVMRAYKNLASYDIESFLKDVSETIQKETSKQLEADLKNFPSTASLQAVCQFLRAQLLSSEGNNVYETLALIFESLSQISWVDDLRGIKLEREIEFIMEPVEMVEVKEVKKRRGVWSWLHRRVKGIRRVNKGRIRME
jgi:hypothetical protein